MPAQGVEAQTLANVYLAIDADHEIIPVLNKIDLPARPSRTASASRSRRWSASTPPTRSRSRPRPGDGIEEVLEALVTRLPPPKGDRSRRRCGRCWSTAGTTPIWAWSSWSGWSTANSKGMKVEMMSTGAVHDVDRVGVFTPKHDR